MRKALQTLIVGVVSVVATNAVRAGPITFVNDYEGFLAAAGDVQTIDFETLPDGSPPVYAIENPITPEYNYTDQGVTFSSYLPRLFVQGTPSTGFRLSASTYPDIHLQNWIIGDLVTPVWAVGAFFPGGSTVYAYDADDNLIASVFAGGGGTGRFAGILSDVPIAGVVIDAQYYRANADSFHFTPIPEPVSLLLLGVGGGILLRGRHRRV